MTGVTITAVVLLLAAAMFGRVGERFVDWILPPRLNFRIGACVARLAVRLARSNQERQEALDALANILASSPDSTDVSPIGSVAPVLKRCAASRIGRLARPLPRHSGGRTWWRYTHTNSKGVTYHLNSKKVTLLGGKVQTIYFFSKDHRPATACDLPGDRTVNENAANGFLTLKRKDRPASKSGTHPNGTAKASSHLTPRRALRSATSFPLDEAWVRDCQIPGTDADATFDQARTRGLAALECSKRSGRLSLVTGAIGESVAALVFDHLGYSVLWQITTPGTHGVDLLLLAPDESVLALEVKGTLQAESIPRLTPAHMQQMSQSDNPAMSDWMLTAEDLYAGVMIVDLATPSYRIALSDDFNRYFPIKERVQLTSLRWLDRFASSVGLSNDDS